MRKVIHARNLVLLWKRLCDTANLMIGLPDYENYVSHLQRRHPEMRIMTKAEFVAERTARRYDGKGAGRCC